MLFITYWRAERLARPQLVANESYDGAKDLHCLGGFIQGRSGCQRHRQTRAASTPGSRYCCISRPERLAGGGQGGGECQIDHGRSIRECLTVFRGSVLTSQRSNA